MATKHSLKTKRAAKGVTLDDLRRKLDRIGRLPAKDVYAIVEAVDESRREEASPRPSPRRERRRVKSASSWTRTSRAS